MTVRRAGEFSGGCRNRAAILVSTPMDTSAIIRPLAAAALGLLLQPAIALAQAAKRPPMEITIVRAVGETCEPDCPEWIAAQGEIVADTPRKLRRVIQSLNGRKLPVLLHSPGGNVDAGIAMGRMIREAGLVAGVGVSPLPEPCAPKNRACAEERRKPVRGVFNLRRGHCASACTFVLAGGVRRVIHPDAGLGVHQVTIMRTNREVRRQYVVERRRVGGRTIEVSRRLVSERVIAQRTFKLDKVPEATNRQLSRHFAAMGLPQSFHDITRDTADSTMRYLNEDEKRSHGIATHTTDLLTALGFDPANRFFSAPAQEGRYFGFTDMGAAGGRATMLEVTADPAAEAAPVTLRLVRGATTLSASGLKMRFIMPDGTAAVAEAMDGRGGDVLTLPISRAALCRFRPTQSASAQLTEGDTVRWSKAGRMMDVLPFAGIRAAVCPANQWDR